MYGQIINESTAHSLFMQEYLKRFVALVVRFELQPIDRILLDREEINGDRWRGGLAEAMLELACLKRWSEPDCLTCDEGARCFYFDYFARSRPHPYLIRPEFTGTAMEGRRTFTGKHPLVLEIVLVGEAIDHMDKFIRAVELLGRIGIGKTRGRYRIVDVSGSQVYHGSDGFPVEGKKGEERMGRVLQVLQVLLDLLTPLKIKEEAVGIHFKDFSFTVFFKLLMKRIMNLNNLYCNGAAFDKDPLEEEKHRLVELSSAITVKPHTRWIDFSRYSSRQHKGMNIGGHIGLVELYGDLSPFYPYLKLGELVGAGAHTTSGFGRYKVKVVVQNLHE